MKFTEIFPVFDSLISGLDGLFTSDEERLEAKTKIYQLQGTVIGSMLEYESRLAQMQADVIQTEAKGESWLQRSWRPLVMLTFTALIVARWLGWAAPNLTPDLEQTLFEIVKIGLGGYVIGRSAEKVAKSIDFGSTKAKD